MPAKGAITERPNGDILISRRPTYRDFLRNWLIAQPRSAATSLSGASRRLFLRWLSLQLSLALGTKPLAIDVGPSCKTHVAAILDETGDSKDAQKSQTYPDPNPLNHRVEYPHRNSPISNDVGEGRSFSPINDLHFLEIENG
jgi:hypothetical protein